MNTVVLDPARLGALLEAAERAQNQGQPQEAARLLQLARSAAPDSPAVLSACGIQALRTGDAAMAKSLLERAIAAEPANPRHYLNLASTLRDLDQPEAELQALNQALTLEPYFFLALIQKASLLEKQGHGKLAATAYHSALSSLRPGSQIPISWQSLIEHARRVVLANLKDLEDWLQQRMREVRGRHAPQAQRRVDECLDVLLGKRRIYVQQPTFAHFPRLPAIPFYEREDFPWLAEVEAATDSIRGELQQLLQHAPGEFVPYLTHASDAPLNQWKELNQSKRWSALFLHKDGEPFQDHIARCPNTVAALAGAPVMSIPHRGPTSFFSRLEPRTRIPPHTGVANTRLIVHLPLVVPGDCGFRVGSETREWQPGRALIFDDTIEHEAWNNSDEPRVILIFDIWNPLLTQAERELMTVASASIAEFYAS